MSWDADTAGDTQPLKTEDYFLAVLLGLCASRAHIGAIWDSHVFRGCRLALGPRLVELTGTQGCVRIWSVMLDPFGRAG